MAKRKIDLQDFRAKVHQLRDKGLISAKTDTRAALPSWIRNGRTLKELVNEFDDVLSEKAQVFKVSDVSEKGYRKTYQRKVLVNPHTGKKQEYLLVPHSADETAYLDKGRIVITHPAGIDRLQIPVEYHNLEQWAKDMKRAKFKREKGVQYGFRLKGGSSAPYRTMDLLLEELTHYQVFEAAVAGSAKFQREIYTNIEIVKVLDTKRWYEQREKNKEAAKRKKQSTTKKRRKKK